MREDKEQQKRGFIEWLDCEKKRLGFKKTDLIKATGISSSTLDNYMTGYSYPTKENYQKIVKFIEDLSEFEGLERIPNKEFAELFYRLLGEFSYKVSQEMLAKELGISQSNISRLQNGLFIPTTAMQKQILQYFYKLAVNGEGWFLEQHIDIGCELRTYLGVSDLFGEWEFTEPEWEMGLESAKMRRKSIELFKQYPLKIQNIILNNIRAFCDDYYFLSVEGIYFYGFYYQCEFMERFRGLSEEAQWDVIHILEEKLKEPMKYWSNRREKEFFLQMTDLQKMMVMTAESQELIEYYYSNEVNCGPMIGEESCELGDPTINSIEFERACSALFDFEVMEEISYKLGLNSKEWYLWSLMIKARFYDVDYETALDELSEEEFE